MCSRPSIACRKLVARKPTNLRAVKPGSRGLSSAGPPKLTVPSSDLTDEMAQLLVPANYRIAQSALHKAWRSWFVAPQTHLGNRSRAWGHLGLHGAFVSLLKKSSGSNTWTIAGRHAPLWGCVCGLRCVLPHLRGFSRRQARYCARTSGTAAPTHILVALRSLMGSRVLAGFVGS